MFFSLFGIPKGKLDSQLSRKLDSKITAKSMIAEDRLEEHLRSNDHLHSPNGLALSMILLGLTLARYTQWEQSNYGKWLANVTNDPYVDLIPPVLTSGLSVCRSVA